METERGREPGALVEAMRRPGFYEHRPDRVELRETHISWVFLAGPLAYKVKKPVQLPFLDYRTLGRRREMCRQEVRLNRRLAPDYYLGVRSIISDGGGRGYSLSAEDDPAAVEYAVEMRPVPQSRTLERVLADGSLRAAEIQAVAERLARFHAEAERAPDPAATVTSLIAALEENHATLNAHADETIPRPRREAAERFTRAWLDRGGRELLRRRAAAGLARDGHGDLRAEHVLLTDPVQIYDCIEFDPALRRLDAGVDLAFLVMDLERLGASTASALLIAAYRQAGGDPGPDRLLAFFASYRAWVRAKVTLLGPEPSRRERAAELHALGHRLAWRARLPIILFVCGTAASGKSTLARSLSRVSGLPVVDADSTRKRLAGLEPTDRAAPEHYSPEFSRRTYERLAADAIERLRRDGGAIIDATGRRRADRDAFRDRLVQAAAGVPLRFARCVARPEALLERARAREADPQRVSDAGLDVVSDQLDAFDPLEEVAKAAQTNVDTELSADEQLGIVEALLDASLNPP